MKKRRWLLACGLGTFAIVVTGLALTGQAQEAPSNPATASPTSTPAAQPKYYQGKVSPPPPGLFPERQTQPPAAQSGSRPLPFGQTPPAFGQPRGGTAQKPPISVPNNPVPNLSAPPGQSVQQSGGFPRLSRPVVAGAPPVAPLPAAPIRPASADEPASAPPFFQSKPTAQPTPATNLPEPKPLPIVTPAPELPTPSLPTTPLAVQPIHTVEGLPSTAPTSHAAPTTTAPPAVFLDPPTTSPQGVPRPEPAALPIVDGSSFQEGTTSQVQSSPLPSRTAPNVTLEAIIPESIGVGQILSYELVVRNAGNSTVDHVRLEDVLPARCEFVSAEPAAESQNTRLQWVLGSLEAGMEKRVKIVVKPLEEGEVRSRATISFSSSMEARTTITKPKIALVMAAPETARVGERIPFQIKLSNDGTGTAGKIYLRAEFTEGLKHPQGQVIEAELVALPAGQTRTLNLEAIASKAGQQLCKLTAVADGVQTELANATLNIVEPLLTIKQSGPTKCLVKSEPVIVIELANPGTATTEPIQLWASLPNGLEFVSATDHGTFLEANRAIGWRLPGLAAGTTKQVSIKLRAVAPTEGMIRTLAQAAAAQPEIVPVEARTGAIAQAVPMLEARAESAMKAEGVPALRFEVFDVEDPVIVGKEALYEIRVVNQGTGPCTNVQLVAEIAEGTVAVGATGPTANRVAGNQMIFEPITEFQVKGEAVYRVRVRGEQPGDFRFRVRLTCNEIRTPTIKEENTRFYKE